MLESNSAKWKTVGPLAAFGAVALLGDLHPIYSTYYLQLGVTELIVLVHAATLAESLLMLAMISEIVVERADNCVSAAAAVICPASNCDKIVLNWV